jgi:hypothetical protein
MELTMEQQVQDFADELAQKVAAHHRVVNAQPRTTRDRIDQAGRARIEQWYQRRKAELMAVVGPVSDPEPPAAQASDTPAAEASPSIVDATPAVVVPGKKI